MAGFTPDGGIKFQDVEDSVIFHLQSSSGQDLKTYRVPSSKADEFQNGIQSEEKRLREEVGEKDPLCLIKISRCF